MAQSADFLELACPSDAYSGGGGGQPSVSGCPVKLLLAVPGKWLQALVLLLPNSLKGYRRAQA